MDEFVAVSPPAARAERGRLFEALGEAFGVRFEGREHGEWKGACGVVTFGRTRVAASVPALRYVDEERPSEAAVGVELAADAAVDERLRGLRFSERTLATIPDRLDGRPLARDARGAVWSADDEGLLQTCIVAPTELAPHEVLRSRLCPGRFLALLPLVHLLRRISDYGTWTRPGVRAAFLFDDPNLHWRSYGHIRFAELAADAERYGYHVAFSMIPFDGWFAHPGVVRTFAASPHRLSLTLHGNDHLFAEFALPRPTTEAVAVATQALGRIARFERRTGLRVDRVMVPPHGLCSDEMLGGLVDVGIEALCSHPAWWSNWPPKRRLTADWHMADVAPSGGPIMRRFVLADPAVREQAALTAFLDQPIVLYGHHYDVSAGYGILADIAEWLRRLGEVTWLGIGALARTNYMYRLEPDGVVRIRTYSRRFDVIAPQGPRTLLAELPRYDAVRDDRVCLGDVEVGLSTAGRSSLAEIPISGDGRLQLQVTRRARVPAAPLPRITAYAIARRVAAETRDRLRPVVEKAGVYPLIRRLERSYVERMNRRLREKSRAA